MNTERFKRAESRIGNVGWLAFVAGVAAWDAVAPETLSSAMHRYTAHPVGKHAVTAAVTLTAAHLLDVPKKLGVPDPFNIVSDYASDRLRQLPSVGDVARSAFRRMDEPQPPQVFDVVA